MQRVIDALLANMIFFSILIIISSQFDPLNSSSYVESYLVKTHPDLHNMHYWKYGLVDLLDLMFDSFNSASKAYKYPGIRPIVEMDT